MNEKLFVVVSLLLIILLSGCIDEPVAGSCSDTGLDLVNYNVYPLEKLYQRNMVTITFWLENKGSSDANDVVINFFDIPGFELVSLECEDGERDGSKCKIDKISTNVISEKCLGEIKEVKASLRSISEGKNTVSFSVNYKYHGNSKLLFNIWEKGLKNQHGSKQHTSTNGPVKVNIDSEFLLKKIVDDATETVTEWTEEGQKFTLNIDIENVGKYGERVIEIEPKDFEVKFSYIKPIGDGNCDLTKGSPYKPKNPIEVPTKKPLICDMEVENIGQEWVLGSVEVNYDYDYKFVKQQRFNIE